MRLSKIFKAFFKSEKTAGLTLIFCTLLSLLLANSAIGFPYQQFWQQHIAGVSITHFINDGLMSVFFLLIGLELKRELLMGELSKKREALFPVLAAVGGMLLPAIIYLFFTYGTPTQAGAGIPMATDIAFALAVLSLLGSRVPATLKIFLTAVAVIDDLGAVLMIAFFYTDQLAWNYLAVSGVLIGLLWFLNFFKVRPLACYLVVGVGLWYAMLHSGIHATISGVLVACFIPLEYGEKKSSAAVLQNLLHRPVAFFILPVFALANTAIAMKGNIGELWQENYAWGIAVGLLLGKPLGIVSFSYLSVKMGWCQQPKELPWKYIVGAGYLGGIGFTMSIFITLLAFTEENIIVQAKWIILLSSLLAGLLGYLYLYKILPKPRFPTGWDL